MFKNIWAIVNDKAGKRLDTTLEWAFLLLRKMMVAAVVASITLVLSGVVLVVRAYKGLRGEAKQLGDFVSEVSKS